MVKNSISFNKIDNSDVAVVFASYPDEIRPKLMFLRRMIIETAASIDVVGDIEETLKWGEPSYLTPETKSGSTIRIDWKEAREGEVAMYFKCTANLVPAFRDRFKDVFRFGGDRSIMFNLNEAIPEEDLKKCVTLALTYHLNKKLDTAGRWEMVDQLLGS